MNINEEIKQQIEATVELHNRAKEYPIPSPIIFDLNGINDQTLQLVEKLFGENTLDGPVIYVVKANAHGIDLIAELKNHKEKVQQQGSTFAVSRINGQQSDVLYVGSKRAGLKARLLQHLGLANGRKVYSLHLKDWLPPSVQLTFEFYRFPNLGNTIVDNAIFQILEDAFWDILKPTFGKKGGNNVLGK